MKVPAGAGDPIDTCLAPSTTTTTLYERHCGVAFCGDGVRGALCHMEELQARPLCGTETVEPELQDFVSRKLADVAGVLYDLDDGRGRRRRALRQVKRGLRAVVRRVDRQMRAQRISERCGGIIQQGVRALLETVAPTAERPAPAV